MEQRVSPRQNEPQLDEEVWHTWVLKNEAKDKVRLARRKKLLVILLILGVVAFVVWRVGHKMPR